jgi:hypothetical protein
VVRGRRILSVAILLTLVLLPFVLTWFQVPRQSTFVIERDLYLGTVRASNGCDVDVRGVYGNLFRPEEAQSDLGFDLVGISCYFDPLRLDDRTVLPVNPLLASAIAESMHDSLAVLCLLDNLFLTLQKSRAVVECYMSPGPSRPCEGDKIVPHIWVSVEGPAPRKPHRIKYMAALPLFDPALLLSHHISPSEARRRLGDNVEAATSRILTLAAEDLEGTVHSVAFAATGSTSRRGGDSPYFLDFTDGFMRTIAGIKASRPPLSIDRVYLVAFDQHQGQFRADALKGLQAVAHKFALERLCHGRKRVFLGAANCLGMFFLGLFSYQQVESIWKGKNRWSLVGAVLPVSLLLGGAVTEMLRLSVDSLPDCYFGIAPWLSGGSVLVAYLIILLLSKRLGRS